MFSHGNLQLIINKNGFIALATNIKISEENHLEFLYFVVNKAKGQISEWVLQENNACQIFRKTFFVFSENLVCLVFL